MPKHESIDLARLREMHPSLPFEIAMALTVRAALGLQRNNHTVGVNTQLQIESAELYCALNWPKANEPTIEQHDSKRITEDGAEAIALAVAHETKSWRVVRRLQQGEHADWLLEHKDGESRRLVAFEVSGTEKSGISSSLRDKLAQVARCTDVHQRSACVVGFKKPRVGLQTAKRISRGH